MCGVGGRESCGSESEGNSLDRGSDGHDCRGRGAVRRRDGDLLGGVDCGWRLDSLRLRLGHRDYGRLCDGVRERGGGEGDHRAGHSSDWAVGCSCSDGLGGVAHRHGRRAGRRSGWWSRRSSTQWGRGWST